MRRIALLTFVIFVSSLCTGPVDAQVRDKAAESALEGVEALMLQERWNDALTALERAVRDHPGYPPLHGAYCRIYWLGFNDRGKTLEHALRLRKEFPDHAEGYYWEAIVRERGGEYEKCLAALTACPCFERLFAHNNIAATCHYNLGHWKEALAALPTPSEVGDVWNDLYGGWYAFLHGQIIKRDVFQRYREELGKAVASADARMRALALVKLAILGVPDAAGMIEQAGKGAKADLATAAGKLKDLLRVKRKLYKPRAVPTIPPGAKPVATPEALARVFQELETIPRGGKLPPITGRYMMREMLQLAKQYPAFAKPFIIEVNPDRGEYSMGAGWVKADGEIAATLEPQLIFYTAAAIGDALVIVSVNSDPEEVSVLTTSIRGKGRDLVQTSRTWTDAGEVFYLLDMTTEFVCLEK
jgi:hypothetical protein